jgi:hypothetical protein
MYIVEGDGLLIKYKINNIVGKNYTAHLKSLHTKETPTSSPDCEYE